MLKKSRAWSFSLAVIGLLLPVFLLFSQGAPRVGALEPQIVLSPRLYSNLKTDLDQLGLGNRLNSDQLTELLTHQQRSGRTLPQILSDARWARELGLKSVRCRATWYVANPFELLPVGLQKALEQTKTPMSSRKDLWNWARAQNLPPIWREALESALIETTAENLWRAAQGFRPYCKNGELLEPIVVDYGEGRVEVRNGHIATDPRVIPTNSRVLLLVRVDGVDHALRVKAADTGSAVKGHHVDLPIQLGPETHTFPYSRMPAHYLKNRVVKLLVFKE